MKRMLIDWGILVVVALILGASIVVSGIMPVKASSGHWDITYWFLDFASDRSIQTHSLGIEVPSLDEPKMIYLGAATYHNNCRWCHGSPGYPLPSPASAMTPSPPDLFVTAKNWEANELFYVVKHGIMFAGMPAWASPNRSDEVWPVVAFLQKLPELDAAEYEHYIAPERPVKDANVESDHEQRQSNLERRVLEQCAACHGLDGNGRAGDRVPLLAGQNQEYVEQAMFAYRDRSRFSGIMQPIAERLSPSAIKEFAEYFAQQPRKPMEAGPENSSLIDAGEKLAAGVIRRSKLASCNECHLAGDMQSGDYPILNGQPKKYLVQQLRLFQERKRGGAEYHNLMHAIADKLSEQEMESLAAYFSSLPTSSSTPNRRSH